MDGPYTPGVCNIHKREIAKRNAYGYLNLLIAAVYLIIVVYYSLSLFFQVLLVFPIFGALLSFWQARQKFCAGFALATMYEDESGEIIRVEDPKQQQKDQERAIRMVIEVALVSTVVTGLIVVVLR